jgi:hypothetical protein
MSDDAQTPVTPEPTPAPEADAPEQEAPKPAAAKPPARKPAAKKAPEPPADEPAPALEPAEDPLKVALRAVQEERDALLVKFKERDGRASALEVEAKKLREQVDMFGKREREGAILEHLRGVLPHASTLELRGALAALHESGKVDRYSDKAEDAARAALELLKTAAPNLVRAPEVKGGPAGAPQQPPTKRSKGAGI